MRSVVFDLDGTLADTSRDLIEAGNTCFQRLGMGNLLDDVLDSGVAMGGGARAMLRLGFARAGVEVGEEVIDDHYPLFLAAYEDNIDRHTVMYPGAVAAVEALRTDGYGVGICTNKPDYLAEMLLERLGVRGLFDAMVGANTLPVRKPDPRPLWEAIARLDGERDMAVLVGDTTTDRETARAAGVHSVLVTFGPEGATAPDLQPDALLSDYRDLPALVRQLIG